MKSMKTEVFYCKSDMHVWPMRFSILSTPIDSSDKKNKLCVLLCCCVCLHPNTILMEAGWTTVPCPATNLRLFICRSSARTKQSVVIVALKTCLEVKLGICIYIKRHFWFGPTTILVSHQAVPPYFTTKCRPCLWRSIWLISCVIKHTLHIRTLVLLIVCVTNQCSQFILFCQWQYVFKKLCAKWCLHLGKLIKLTFGN